MISKERAIKLLNRRAFIFSKGDILSEEEAEKETKKIATDNIATMRQYGFSVTDHGYIGEDNKLSWEKHKDYVFLEYDEVGEAVYDVVTRYHCPACEKGNYKKPPRFCPNCGKELGAAN